MPGFLHKLVTPYLPDLVKFVPSRGPFFLPVKKNNNEKKTELSSLFGGHDRAKKKPSALLSDQSSEGAVALLQCFVAVVVPSYKTTTDATESCEGKGSAELVFVHNLRTPSLQRNWSTIPFCLAMRPLCFRYFCFVCLPLLLWVLSLYILQFVKNKICEELGDVPWTLLNRRKQEQLSRKKDWQEWGGTSHGQFAVRGVRWDWYSREAFSQPIVRLIVLF